MAIAISGKWRTRFRPPQTFQDVVINQDPWRRGDQRHREALTRAPLPEKVQVKTDQTLHSCAASGAAHQT